MSKPRSLNPHRNRCRTESSRVSASGAGGGSAASSTSDKKRKSTENEKQVSQNKKKKETDLTGKEIAESIKEGRLAPLQTSWRRNPGNLQQSSKNKPLRCSTYT